MVTALVADYLDRIAYSGPVNLDLETLAGIHRAHITTIPYENLEIQLGRENVLAESAFVAKLVHGRRGGWCYEMNGLLTWALRQIGPETEGVGQVFAALHHGSGGS